LGPVDLFALLPKDAADPRLLVGMDTRDDAGVMRLSPEMALISTVDMITPVADDPFIYGQIAAANSLSDVYAMGGEPVGALNVCCFPEKGPAPEALARILEGGLDRLREAGALLLGGHTVRDPELKYGLAVNGIIHPDKVVRNHTVRAGDRLVLTKALGCGLLMSAWKKGQLSEVDFQAALDSMASLNRDAARAMMTVGVHAATDVTGFGLLGHLWEMLSPGGFALELELEALPLYAGAREAAGTFGVSGPMRRNLALPAPYFKLPDELSDTWKALVADPQTSGGLLISLPAAASQELLALMKERGLQGVDIGQVLGPGAKSQFKT
jgi:selenide,water dikinase